MANPLIDPYVLDPRKKIQSGNTARSNAAAAARLQGQADAYFKALAAKKGQQVAPPNSASGGSVSYPSYNGDSGGGSDDGGVSAAASAAAAAESRARQAGKDQTAKQNQATQAIINTLLSSLKGYEAGRDTQVKNANKTLNQALEGIMASLQNAVGDYEKTGIQNEEDQASKSAANLTNRARERVALLQQAASQGAGETDQLRAQIQAFLNSDANQLEVDRSFFDTQRQINSQIEGANSQAETARRSAFNQNQEAIGNAWNEFWKNRSDIFTNVQRTAAQNTNVDSDYSTGFSADFRGFDPTAEAARDAGRAYKIEEKDESFFKAGRREGRNTKTTSTSQAGTTRIKAPKAAEGATLRGRW